jgi:iron complex transport system substrate-binding protein
MKFEELVAADPDVILIAPCGFNMDRTAAELSLLTARPEWAGLKAVRERKVFLGEGNQYFNRPGPRIVESLEILAEILHPDLFSFGHQGSGWRSA